MGEAVEGMDKRDKILQSGGHRPRLLYNYRLSFRANRTGAGVGWQISGEKIKQFLASLKESPPCLGVRGTGKEGWTGGEEPLRLEVATCFHPHGRNAFCLGSGRVCCMLAFLGMSSKLKVLGQEWGPHHPLPRHSSLKGDSLFPGSSQSSLPDTPGSLLALCLPHPGFYSL